MILEFRQVSNSQAGCLDIFNYFDILEEKSINLYFYHTMTRFVRYWKQAQAPP